MIVTEATEETGIAEIRENENATTYLKSIVIDLVDHQGARRTVRIEPALDRATKIGRETGGLIGIGYVRVQEIVIRIDLGREDVQDQGQDQDPGKGRNEIGKDTGHGIGRENIVVRDRSLVKTTKRRRKVKHKSCSYLKCSTISMQFMFTMCIYDT